MRSHISRSARRALQIAVLGGATLWLTACGYSKPEPAKLEEFRPSNKVSVVWQQRLDSMTPALTLALKGDTLAAVSADGQVAAWQAGSGKPVWSGSVATSVSAGVGTDGRYAAAVTEGNELVVLDQGKSLWRQPLPGRVTTPPLVAGERVFVMMLDRNVRAYDVLDGRWLWQYQRPGGEPLALATSAAVPVRKHSLKLASSSGRMWRTMTSMPLARAISITV